MKERVRQLDYVRTFAMLAVIVIHCTSTYIYHESRIAFLGMNLGWWLNNLSRFAVPIFVLLSGVSLAVSPPADCRKFIRGRVKIIIHYLIWSMAYYIFYLQLGWMQVLPMREFAKRFLIGSMSDQLYFVPVIVQLYVLYYPLRAAVRKAPMASLVISLVITVYFQLAVTVRGCACLLPAVILPYAWLLFPSWLFYFVLGLCFDRSRLEKMCAFSKRALLPICVLALAYGVVGGIVVSTKGILWETLSPTVIIYTVLIFLALTGISSAVEVPALDGVVKKLSAMSFTVYLSHIVVLQLGRMLPLSGMSGMLVLLVCTLIGSIILSGIYDRVFACLKK